MRSMIAPVAALAIAALAAGCGASQAHPENPAYILHATPESRTALAQAVEKALDGTQVPLDDDALTRDNVLTIELAQARDPRAQMLGGRDPGKPGFTERFHLVKIGDHCVLVHDRTGRHYDLIGTDCAPM